jgi:small subunit ribosomal protein S14
MAKTSSIEKNNRRKKLAKQFGAKRTKLKAIAMNQSVPIEERFAAQLKLAACATGASSRVVPAAITARSS